MQSLKKCYHGNEQIQVFMNTFMIYNLCFLKADIFSHIFYKFHVVIPWFYGKET